MVWPSATSVVQPWPTVFKVLFWVSTWVQHTEIVSNKWYKPIVPVWQLSTHCSYDKKNCCHDCKCSPAALRCSFILQTPLQVVMLENSAPCTCPAAAHLRSAQVDKNWEPPRYKTSFLTTWFVSQWCFQVWTTIHACQQYLKGKRLHQSIYF